MNYVSSKKASQYYKVSTQTLRRWADSGQIEFIRTKGKHRRYKINQNKEKGCYIYTRVSSKKQQHDLKRQTDFLLSKFPNYEVISDIASGINFKRKGFTTLLDKILRGNVKIIVVSTKDRFTRFGYELIERICNRFGTKIMVIKNEKEQSFEEELSEDLMSIITVFTARYYGSRKYKILQKNSDIS